MARILILGLGMLTLLGCEPVGKGVATVGSTIATEAENPRNEVRTE
jgi:hypothetical protein